jgi:hypothetical protein
MVVGALNCASGWKTKQEPKKLVRNTMSITIDLVDKRYIILRSKMYKNGAEMLQFSDEKKAREHLKFLLKYYKKEGYVATEVDKDAFELRK